MDPKSTSLRDLVRRHKVVFDVYPARELVEGKSAPIGYDVEIGGVHEASVQRAMLPGCERCEALFEDLRALAFAVIPADLSRASRYEIRAFDRSLHTARRSGSTRDEVKLTVEVRHRRDYLRPADECEERCLREIVAALRNLGAQERAWSESEVGNKAGSRPTP